jgi:SnoaL-like domain
MTAATSDFTLTETEDRLAILELISRLALTIDARDWNALGQLFTDTVYHDRTSLTGGEPTTLGVAEDPQVNHRSGYCRYPSTVSAARTCA